MPETLAIRGHVATLCPAGPLDAAFVAALGDACAALAEDARVRVVIFDPAHAWEGWTEVAYADAEELGLIGDPLGPLAALPQPTIAVCGGDVLDGGLELALCTDIRLAAPEARFGFPGIPAGRLPIAGGLQRLARALGRSRALDLALRGTLIDAETAVAWGLISGVGADPAADAEALAAEIATRGPLGTRFAKEAVARGLEMPLEQALRYETDLTVLLQTTDDRAEGVRAFREKRPPEFQGR